MPETNPCSERLDSLMRLAARRRLDAVAVFGEANIRSLTGVVCDNGCLLLDVAGGRRVVFLTDFRYVPMVHRVAPWLRVREVRRGVTFMDLLRADGIRPTRLGYESTITAARYLALKKRFPKAALVDVSDDILSLRAVKSVEEIARIAAAAALNDEIWARARKDFKPGMTEKDIQRVIQEWMIALGDGEAFETIVCAGANAAECHHVPDDTVWRRGEPLLVDMGVKLDGVCSDMTRNVKAARDPEPGHHGRRARRRGAQDHPEGGLRQGVRARARARRGLRDPRGAVREAEVKDRARAGHVRDDRTGHLP